MVVIPGPVCPAVQAAKEDEFDEQEGLEQKPVVIISGVQLGSGP